MNTVIVKNCKTLFIGRRGENEVTEVLFDFSEWQEQFGAGVIDLYVKRNLDIDAYPVVLSVDGTVATWLVSAADTDVVGNGKIEYVYTVNEKIAKSAIFQFFVGDDIGESSPEPPEHYQSWLEQLTELGAETQANAQAAAQSASEAAESASEAAESASEAAESAAQVAEDSNNAEAWAVGERNGEPVSEGDPTYDNNAKYWAENARANAPVQSVNGEDGYVVLTLDDIPNGETYVRTTPEQLAQIATNSDDIADVKATADTALQPDDLRPYRTAAAQDAIDQSQNTMIGIAIQGKQAKITASGILKGDGAGGVSSAVAGTDYATPQQVSEKYTKPSSGIPSTDMTAAVQASLIKADTALQAVPDTYRTAADQDLIDNGKQAKITASGILKGDGAGGVSAAVAGVDYLKSAPVTSVNGQTGDVTIQPATDAQVTTAVNTWLGENVAQETGYVLDASLTMSNAAPPASAVGDLKSAFITDTEAITGNTPLVFTPGRYLASSGTMKAGLQVSFAENGETPFMCAISPCQPGDKFTAHIIGSSGTNRAYLFCDADMKTVAGGWPVANYELNGTRTAPAGAAFVVFNNRMPSLPNGYYAVKGVALKKVVDDMILEPSGVDQTQAIMSKLGTDGFCQLGSGDFLVSNIIMPSGSKLCGCGEATRLHFATGATGNMVTMGDCCTVCDISFYGAEYVDGSGNPISIESAKSTVTVDGDFPGSQIENETAVNLWTEGTVNVDSGIEGIVLATPIAAGTYRVTATLSRSDSSSTQGRIRFSKDASQSVGPSNVIAQADFYKNDRMSATITVDQPIQAVQFISVIGSTTAVSDWENIRITKIDSNKSGICWTGDSVHFGNVRNCRFFYFDVAGILMQDTGTPVDRNLYVSDCFFFKNNVGAYIRKDSEYNKFSSCAFNYNYYGSLNRGGNNYFSNCGFDANYVGCQVDSFEGSNGGHGGLSNCSLNHSAPSNTGYGLIVDREEQVIISNCVLGHSNALLNRASGCVLNSCMFIGSITITINKGNSNMLIGNYFQGGNTIVKAIDNTKTKVINCYYFVSGDAVPLVTETT